MCVRPVLGAGATSLLDLMVYAVARERGEPLLCTGKSFAATESCSTPQLAGLCVTRSAWPDRGMANSAHPEAR